MRNLLSFQKSVDDLLLGLLFGQPQCHQLDELFTGDFANGGFMNEGGIDMVGGKRRRGDDTCPDP